MAYVVLVAHALICAAAGFLLHAFYLSPRRNPELARQSELLGQALRDRQRELEAARAEIMDVAAAVSSLEQQAHSRDAELQMLRARLAALPTRGEQPRDALKPDAECAASAARAGSADTVAANAAGAVAAAPEPEPAGDPLEFLLSASPSETIAWACGSNGLVTVTKVSSQT